MDKATVKAHKISDDEYENILKILGREPNLLELGIFSAMWSEHCSYKSSKKYLNGFPTKAPWVIQGPGENAGVIDVGGGVAAVFKMESHNHPSFIEPFQGAATGVRRRESLWSSYKRLWRTLVALHRTHPEVLWFLLAAAVFRDGLAGVFTYGGIIAKSTFGFSSDDVLVFAVAANVIAGVATIVSGRLDDRIGPRKVILGSLTILVCAGVGVFFLHNGGANVFWILGLLLAGCVGPTQSAARSFLARVIPEGREGEIFGLYATTGRAVSFMAPALYGGFIWIGVLIDGKEASHWGILGIVTILVIGLLLTARIKDPAGHITDLGD